MGTLQKLEAKKVLNAESAVKMSIASPQKPKKVEDKKQSCFRPAFISSNKIGGQRFPIPKKHNWRRK